MAADAAGLAALLPATGSRARLDVASVEGRTVRVRIVRLRDETVAGEASLTADEGSLVISALDVAPEARRYGIGSECGALLRDLGTRAGFAALRAWAPPDAGLAVYFWMRMGLRPLFGEGPHGGIWFERRL